MFGKYSAWLEDATNLVTLISLLAGFVISCGVQLAGWSRGRVTASRPPGPDDESGADRWEQGAGRFAWFLIAVGTGNLALRPMFVSKNPATSGDIYVAGQMLLIVIFGFQILGTLRTGRSRR